MFTFLIDHFKASTVRLYRLRLLSIHFGLLVVVLLTGVALAVPTYAFLNTKRDAALIEKNSPVVPTKDDPSSIESDVQSLKEKIDIIKAANGELPIVSVLDRILSRRIEGITITSFSLKRNTETGSITINGIASSRENLVDFSKTLDEEPAFTNVNLPVDSLAKSKNVPFTIIIDSKF
jgi:hypothetical protein